MPSIRYINQSAPFWDFIANMEEQGAQHPFFAGPRNDGPQAWGWGGPHHWHRGPPPHPHHHRDAGEGPSNQAPPAAPAEGAAPAPDADGQTPPTAPAGAAEHDGPFQHRPHPYHRRGGCHGRRGGRGGHGPWGNPNFSGSPLGGLEAFLNSALFGADANNTTAANGDSNTQTRASEDFHPDADVFDTETSFQIHISLPGAKKEDIGVNWDAEKSELSVAGVIYRPGNEEFLKTLAMDERKVGAFEKKIRLGTRASAAQVDAEGISAKLEDGVLRVEVPKLEGEFVEVRKVDVE